ncbi:MAG TPA: hypothetical protein VH143_08705 [Kofleriaceae bacterium]|nr:hypothetical protein [Kofleriaceae bacterium]
MRFLAVAWSIAMCSCGAGNSSRTAAIDHPPLADLDGAYWCVIEQSSLAYPPYPCTIQNVDHRRILAKLGGSQRFEGEIQPVAGGFSFAGVFFCPWGECTQPLHGTFEPSEGGLVGTFRDSTIIVRMTAVKLGTASHDATLYGGASYGGASYGDAWSGH